MKKKAKRLTLNRETLGYPTGKLLHCGCLHQQLERFARGESPRDECRLIVRHLLTRCPECLDITRRIFHGYEPVPPPPGTVAGI